ncbi:MAG TPA: YceI family protein [Candidatus Kapabacteria bacterium]|jgi:polyisoprenoid-binding protein YceI
MNNIDTIEAPQKQQVHGNEVLTTTWNLDKAHSAAGFSVRHLMISNVRGEFRELTGTLQYDPLHIEHSAISVTIQTDSIDTREPNRDTHLKSADFFEVEKYPEITFQSNAWQHKNDDELLVKGNLTMHGVTREVTLNVERTPLVTDPWGGTRVGFTGKTKINRKDFGLTYGTVIETGNLVVGEEVTIALEAEFVKV